jgi:hypothetical protein
MHEAEKNSALDSALHDMTSRRPAFPLTPSALLHRLHRRAVQVRADPPNPRPIQRLVTVEAVGACDFWDFPSHLRFFTLSNFIS